MGGSKTETLNVLDLGILARAAYSNNTAAVAILVNKSFEGLHDLHITNQTMLHGHGQLPTLLLVRFAKLSRPDEPGTVVVAVKGTSTSTDVLLDESMYAHIQVLQWVSLMVPILDLM